MALKSDDILWYYPDNSCSRVFSSCESMLQLPEPHNNLKIYNLKMASYGHTLHKESRVLLLNVAAVINHITGICQCLSGKN